MRPTGLNNRWFDACQGLQTAERKAALGYLAEYAREPANYLYVKHRSAINTLDEIKNNANIGIVHLSFRFSQGARRVRSFIIDLSACNLKLTDHLRA